MDSVTLAAQIREGRLPNVPPEMWAQVRERLTAKQEADYWAAARALEEETRSPQALDAAVGSLDRAVRRAT